MTRMSVMAHLTAFCWAFPYNLHAQNLDSVRLQCVDVKGSFAIQIETDGINIWLDGRLQSAIFSDDTIVFKDPELGDFVHELNRFSGKLTVFNSVNKTIDSTYICQKSLL